MKNKNVLDVLNALVETGLLPLHRRDLCKQLKVEPAAMSRHLKRLVEAGWARRVPGGFGYIIGVQLARAVGVINEDCAITAERLGAAPK